MCDNWEGISKKHRAGASSLSEAEYLKGCVPLHLPTPDFFGMVSSALLEEFIFFGERATTSKVENSWFPMVLNGFSFISLYKKASFNFYFSFSWSHLP